MNNLQLNVNLKGSDSVSRPLRNVMAGAKSLAQQLNDTRNKLKQLSNTQKNVNNFVQLKKQFDDLKNKSKSLAIELKKTANPTKALQREFNKTAAETRKLKDRLTPLRAELQQSGISTKNLAQHQITLKNKIASANQSIKQQSEQLKQLNQRQQKANQIKLKYDAGMQRAAVLGGVGYGALATGRTVARGMTNMLHVGYEFDASMSSTQAVTRINDKNDPRMIALRKQARELPLVSKFTDSEVAQGQYFLGRTGYDADQITKAMPHMLNLAAAGDIDLATTADIASNIQKAMLIPAEEMGQVSDVLTAAFTRNNVDIPMLGESLKYTAGISRQYGQSLETLTTATALLGNAGVQGSQAGTSLRQVLIRIGNSSAVRRLGVKTTDKNGNMRDLGDIFEEIQKATSKLGNVRRGTIYKDIAGQIGVTGFNELMATVETGEFQAMRHNLYNSKGEAEKVAKIKLDNLAGDMTMLRAAFENISVELFEKNNDWLRGTVQGFTKFLHWVSEFLKKHPALSKALVMIGAGIAVVTTAFGGLALALMSIFGPMLITRFILSRLGLSLGGFFVKSGVANRGILSFFKSLISFITPGKKTGSIFNAMGVALKSPTRLFAALPKIISLIVWALRVLGGPLSLVILAGSLIYKYWQPISAFFIGFWEGLKESLTPVVEEFSFLKTITTAVGYGFKWIGNKICDLIKWFSSLFDPVKSTKEELDGAKAAGKSFGTSVGNAVKKVTRFFQGLYKIAEDVVNYILSIPNKISELPKKIEGIFTGENGLFSRFTKIGSDISDGLVTGINNKWDETKKAVTSLGENVSNWFKSTLDIHSPSRVFAKFGDNTVGGYVNGIDRSQPSVLRSITRFADNTMAASGKLNDSVIIDQRSPIGYTGGNSQYYITVHAAPGMNEKEIARQVAQEIERRDRNQSARYRSSLRDID